MTIMQLKCRLVGAAQAAMSTNVSRRFYMLSYIRFTLAGEQTGGILMTQNIARDR